MSHEARNPLRKRLRALHANKTIRTNERRTLKPYTYLGCPLTRLGSAWCYRICEPDVEGNGRCGRLAPHTLRSTIQLAIDRYDEERERERSSELAR